MQSPLNNFRMHASRNRMQARIRIVAGTLFLCLLGGCFQQGPDVSDTIRADEHIRLEIDGSSIVVEPGALPAGIRVGLSSASIEELDESPLVGTERAASAVITVHFSETLFAEGQYIVEIAVSPRVDTGVFPLIRSIGGMSKHAGADSGWQPGTGTFDRDRSVLVIPLSSTAETISVIAVTTGDVNSANLETPGHAGGIADSLGRLVGIEQAWAATPTLLEVGGDRLLTSRGWAVRCREGEFADASLCADDSPTLTRLAQAALGAAQALSNLDFNYGYLMTTPVTNLEQDPRPHAKVESVGSGTHAVDYFVIDLVKEIPSPDPDFVVIGEYDDTQGVIKVTPAATADTVIHEIMHSVQRVEISNFWYRDWVIEATAAAVQPFAPGSPTKSGMSFRRCNPNTDAPTPSTHCPWRNWKHPLSDQESVNPRRTGEFWHAIDGDLGYLSTVFRTMATAPDDIGALQDYQVVNRAFENLQTELGETYLRLITNRARDAAYPHYETGSVTCSDHRCSFSDANINLETQPMAARSFSVAANVDLDCDRYRTQVEVDGDPETDRFFVNGQLLRPGEKVEVRTDFDFWTANLNHASDNPSTPTAHLLAECAGPVEIIAQNHLIQVRAESVEQCQSGGVHYNCGGNQVGSGLEYRSDNVGGHGQLSRWQRDVRQNLRTDTTDANSAPIGLGNRFDHTLRADGDGGSTAEVHLDTWAEQTDEHFVLRGSYRTSATAASGRGWFGRAAAEVDYAVHLIVTQPSTVTIENCDAFNLNDMTWQMLLGMHWQLERDAGECRMTMLLNEEDFQIMKEVGVTPMAGLMPDADYQNLQDFPQGAWLPLTLRAEVFVESQSDPAREGGSFTIRIEPD